MRSIVLSVLLLLCIGSFAQTEKRFDIRAAIGNGDYKSSFGQALFVIGKRTSPGTFIGVGTGVGYGERYTNYYIDKVGDITVTSGHIIPVVPVPLFVNGVIDLSGNSTAPFIAVNAGYTFDMYLTEGQGLMINPYVGFRVKKEEKSAMYFSLGLNLQQDEVTVISDTDYYYDSTWLKAFEVKFGLSF